MQAQIDGISFSRATCTDRPGQISKCSHLMSNKIGDWTQGTERKPSQSKEALMVQAAQLRKNETKVSSAKAPGFHQELTMALENYEARARVWAVVSEESALFVGSCKNSVVLHSSATCI